MFGSADALAQAEKDKRNRKRRAARKRARLVIAGEALSHCVANSVRDIAFSFDEWFARVYGSCPPSAGVIRQMKKMHREAYARAERLARSLRYEADLLCAYRAAKKAWQVTQARKS